MDVTLIVVMISSPILQTDQTEVGHMRSQTMTGQNLSKSPNNSLSRRVTRNISSTAVGGGGNFVLCFLEMTKYIATLGRLQGEKGIDNPTIAVISFCTQYAVVCNRADRPKEQCHRREIFFCFPMKQFHCLSCVRYRPCCANIVWAGLLELAPACAL